MKQSRYAILLGVMSIVGSALAQQGVIDRSLEVDHYVQTIQTGPRISLTRSALEIVDADLSDARLGSVIHEKLISDLPQLTNSDVDEKYLKAMIAALASTGISEYKGICQHVADTKYRARCDQEFATVDWYKTRNQLAMIQRPEFNSSESRMARIANLLAADNYEFKMEAAKRMNQYKVLDNRLMIMIDTQVLAYTSSKPSDDNETYQLGVRTMAVFVKLLGYSGNTQYRATLDKVIQSKVHSRIKDQAKEAQKRLTT